MAEDKDKAKQKTENKPKVVPDKRLKINETAQNKNIEEVTNAVNDLIAETGDDASPIDEDKSYLGLRVMLLNTKKFLSILIELKIGLLNVVLLVSL